MTSSFLNFHLSIYANEHSSSNGNSSLSRITHAQLTLEHTVREKHEHTDMYHGTLSLFISHRACCATLSESLQFLVVRDVCAVELSHFSLELC